MMLKHYFTQPQNRSFLFSLKISFLLLLLCAMSVPSILAQSEIHYSDQWADDSVEDELQAVGVGITEADYDTEAESYTIETNLKSPTGETVSTTADGYTYTRAELTMPWNFNFGNWFASSSHWGIYQQCTYVHIWRSYTCRNTRVHRLNTYNYAEYADNGSQTLNYRLETQRLRADYCPYVICLIHEDSYCASGRRGITRYDGGGPGLDTCPAGYTREFKIVSFRGYKLYCAGRGERFLNFNPC